MTYSILLTILIFTLYVGYLIKHFFIPTSISESYYLLKRKWIFTIMMFVIAILCIAPAVQSLENSNYQFVAFFICVSVGFIGAAPAFQNGLDRKVHLISATILLVLAELYMCVFLPYWYIAIIGLIGIAYPIYLDIKKCKQDELYYSKWLFWVELGILFPLLITLLITTI